MLLHIHEASLGEVTPARETLALLEAATTQAATIYKKYMGSCMERRLREAAQLAFEIATLEPLGRHSVILAAMAVAEFMERNKLERPDIEILIDLIARYAALGDVEGLAHQLARRHQAAD
ncbi:MAG: hypothetical protein F7C09_07595 [Aeropyrum sp.]|nr:hypothetical protein [Aeropyrum sp.]